MGFKKSFKKAIGKHTLNIADNVFGPKSWKTGAMIGSGILGGKMLGMFGSGGAVGNAGTTLQVGEGPAQVIGGANPGLASSFLNNWGPSMIGTIGNVWSAHQQSKGMREANDMNLASAREQMQFQERLSSTAHQREVADLKAAGLNPALSANSGASTPVGASADVGNAAPNYAPAIATAFEGRRLTQEMSESGSRIAINKATKLLQEEQTKAAAGSAKIAEEEAKIRAANRVEAEQEAQYLRNHPNYIKIKKALDLLSPITGAARDIGITKKMFERAEPISVDEVFGPKGEHKRTTIRKRGNR